MRTLENIGLIFGNAQVCFLNGVGSPNSGKTSRESLDWSKLAAINLQTASHPLIAGIFLEHSRPV